jgi:hypothetical protein
VSAVMDIVDDSAEFFAPASFDMIDGLISQYQAMRKRIEQVAAMVTGETAGAIGYFLDGNGSDSRYAAPSVGRLFQVDGAIAALNSAYWSKAMQLTDVLNYMPQQRRSEWSKSITERTCPEFSEETVRGTLFDLLNMRGQFLAERVDGIFRALSGEHVTNSPAAFGKRMIIAHLVSSYGTTNHDRVGSINDLRCVVAKFMGRDEPKWDATSHVVETARRERRGEWVMIDGGAMRLRAYKCGTAHMEVHPDMAWRLNRILAHLYPMAIPPEFRAKPKKKAKDFVMMGRPLPFAVVEALASLEPAYRLIKNEGLNAWRQAYRREMIKNAVAFRNGGPEDKSIRAEVERVLSHLGGVKMDGDRHSYFEFDYCPSDVISEVICSGCIPDQKAHQFYPTPESVATVAIEMAQIGPDDFCLEPSAGLGGLAGLMPKERTTCVEISGLHCKVLEAKGHRVVWNDFLPWASGRAAESKAFDRIVMNPPYSEGRWMAHLEAAASLLAPGGRLVAILPASARGKDLLPGMKVEWSRVFDNEFAGTSVSVVIGCWEKP